MRQLRWSDNSAITVFVLPSQHPLHQRFAKERLQMFPYQLNRIWHKLTYSGLGVAPTIVKSEQELIQAIIETPGAIGYVSEARLITINQAQSTKNTVTNNTSKQAPIMEEGSQVTSKGVVNVIQIKG